MPDWNRHQAATSRGRLRLGIRCDHGHPDLSADPAVSAYLRDLLCSFTDNSEPPEIVLLTGSTGQPVELEGLGRLKPEVVRGRADRTGLFFWSMTLCGFWLRWSNRLAAWSGRCQVRSDDWRRCLGERLRRQPLLLIALLLLWPAYGVWRLLASLLWGFCFPLWMADRVIRRLTFRLRCRESEPFLAADCDAWLVPYPGRWPLQDVPALLLLSHAGQLTAGRLPQAEQGVPDIDKPESHACLALTLDGSRPSVRRQRWLGLPAHRVRAAPDSWRELFDEVTHLAPSRRGLDSELLRPWPERLPARAATARPLEAFLFLQIPWGGGNWEHTRELVTALAEISAHDRRLRLSLGLHKTQPGAWALDALQPSIPVHRFHLSALARSEAARLGADAPRWLGRIGASRFCFFSGAAEAALHADAWLALSDRFPLPLLPARPYAVVVHDMIHLHVPEALGRVFFRNLSEGMTPTLQLAARIIATSPGTRDDVLASHDLSSDRVELIPVACEPQRRFAKLPTGCVPLPRREFILSVTNASPHKGADLMLRAQANLKQRLGPETPLLVLCGVNTEYLAPSQGPTGHAWWNQVRRLQKELDLREQRDVVFLGMVTDIELKDLYRRCQAVVNTARHDNGTYCLIEAAWFGRPVVSTRYPGAEFLAKRFGLPVRFAPIDDAGALAEALAQSLAQGPADTADLAALRDHLAAPEFSVANYAARLYEMLVELAIQRRQASMASAEVGRLAG